MEKDESDIVESIAEQESDIQNNSSLLLEDSEENDEKLFMIQSSNSSESSSGAAIVVSNPGSSPGSGTQQILTLEQLTPAKLLELQHKGLIQISTAPTTTESNQSQQQQGSSQGTIHIAVNPTNILRNPDWENGQNPGIFEPCVVCNDKASGRHYGAKSCEGCKGFFKRSIRKNAQYSCRRNQECQISKPFRNRCQACRLQKCISMGMRPDSVQCERSPIQRLRDRENQSNTLSFTTEADLRRELGYSADFPLNVDKIKTLSDQNTSQGSLTTLANVVSTLESLNREDKSDDTAQNSVHDAIRNGDLNRVNKGLTVGQAIQNLRNSLLSTNSTSAETTSTSNTSTTTIPESTQVAILDFEGTLMLPSNFEFKVAKPTLSSETIDVQHICETASRLLFASAQWARGIFAFNILSDMQTMLFRECWNELFTLGLAQCGAKLKLDKILSTIVQHLQAALQKGKLSLSRVREVMEHVVKLQESIAHINKLEPDKMEYAFLKVITLFNPDNVRMKGKAQIQRFQSRALAEFQNYENEVYPNNPDRLAMLLLRLPALRRMDPSITEELFFAGLIENVQIDSIIPHILKMNTNTLNSNNENQEENGAVSNETILLMASNKLSKTQSSDVL